MEARHRRIASGSAESAAVVSAGRQAVATAPIPLGRTRPVRPGQPESDAAAAGDWILRRDRRLSTGATMLLASAGARGQRRDLRVLHHFVAGLRLRSRPVVGLGPLQRLALAALFLDLEI